MPKKPMDYSKTIIYKIVCNDNSVVECYIGHTINFKSRKNAHKNSCYLEKDREYNKKLYQMIREHGGWDNWTMTPICEYPCENYIQACIKEEEYRIELQAKLNSYKCYADSQTKEYMSQYREKHKETLVEKRKEYCEKNKKKIAEKSKEYREKNKEKINEQQKEWHKMQRQENKEKINEQQRLRYHKRKLVQTEN